MVIATDAKLQYLLDSPEYEWLQDAGCVVIDEAHVSTAPSYTEFLEWLGLARGRQSRPLIGLTATPFRSNEAETSWLVNRYGGERLDHNLFDGEQYKVLQDMGVLSRVEHELIKGVEIPLTEAESKHFEQYRDLSPSAGVKLGADRERNERLLAHIAALDEDWPVLLFAVSPDHASTIASLLDKNGISAASITANTDTNSRRKYISQFRSGEIRVLTNYMVLTAGFDAPQIRALYVARPTYSPVQYQQMIGRGLRGPKNGGKEECLIVNVEDNVRNFGDALAFTQFEFLWEKHE